MPRKYQSTGLNRNFTNAINRLEAWAENPWRRYSLLLIIFLGAFILGSTIGMISAVEGYWDTSGALFTVIVIEIMVRLRINLYKKKGSNLIMQLIDMTRVGLIYGLFMEGFKLLVN